MARRQTGVEEGGAASAKTARSVLVHFAFFLVACSLPYLIGHGGEVGRSLTGPLLAIMLWALLAGVEESIQPAKPKTVIHHDTRWRRCGIWALLAVLPAAAIDASFSLPLLIAGTALASLGIVFRVWSLATLGDQFTWTAGVIKDHVIIKHGPYRFFRHPNYAGTFLFASGIAILTGSLLAWVPIAVLATCILISARHETKFLRSHLPGYR